MKISSSQAFQAVFIRILVGFLIVSFCSSLIAKPYIVIAEKPILNKLTAKKIELLGGKITKVHANLGFAYVDSESPTFVDDVTNMEEIRSVINDVKFQWLDPNRKVFKADDILNPPSTGDDDFFFDLQWGHDAIDAPEAWDLGADGEGVRVAVLDDGIDSDHPDIAPNINLALCKSFVPGQPFEYLENYPGDPFSHGTHVSGTILAADNGYGTIGVAPKAELVMVKVLDSYTGSGYWSWILDGIVYAADIGADVISMSLGGYAEMTPENAEFLYVLGMTTRYAFDQGSTVIASTGNGGYNLDDYPGILHIPSDAPRVIAVSATTPIGWAVDFTTNLDLPASYSNYGINHVDFAAPGGDVLYPGNESCVVAGLNRPCFVFDLVFSTGSAGGWYWSAGTSMAVPHVSGVVALMIGEAGGYMPPDAVFQTLRRTADDLGPKFKDNFYGNGRVNAHKAVMRIQRFNKSAESELAEVLQPTDFELSQNYPNPFNPSTTISFGIPSDNNVTLKVFDLLGREVAELVNGFRTAGFYSVEFDATQLSSGMYIYQIQAGDFIDTKKLILQK